MKTSQIGREIIEVFEACMRAAPGRPGLFTTYRDSVNVLTIGYGHTNAAGPPHIVPGVVWTKQQCDDSLTADLGRVETTVEHALAGHSVTPLQFDALVSFEYNTGHLTNPHCSIMPKLLRDDLAGAVATLLLYDHAGGQVLRGLTRRRNCEAALMRGNLSLALEFADLHVNSDDVVETAVAVTDHHEAPPQPVSVAP